MKRISRRRIRLADVQPYVFCQEYRQQTQRRGQAGTFEIQFYSEEGKRIATTYPPIPIPWRENLCADSGWIHSLHTLPGTLPSQEQGQDA